MKYPTTPPINPPAAATRNLIDLVLRGGLTTGVQLLARAPQRVLTHAGRVTVSCNGMSGGAPGALLKRPSREAPAGNGTPVGPIRLPELRLKDRLLVEDHEQVEEDED